MAEIEDNVGTTGPSQGPPVQTGYYPDPGMSRIPMARKKELAAIAGETVDFIAEKGVKRSELCFFSALCHRFADA